MIIGLCVFWILGALFLISVFENGGDLQPIGWLAVILWPITTALLVCAMIAMLLALSVDEICYFISGKRIL